MDAQIIIDSLNLLPHPEGGFYKETYRSTEQFSLPGKKTREVCTAIYYLLRDDERSHFHRITSDELWFFHSGAALDIYMIRDAQLEIITLGSSLEKGECLQAVIPAGIWFAAGLKDSAGYALVSCTVAPGFDFSDFELGEREPMCREFPHLKESITRFTRQ